MPVEIREDGRASPVPVSIDNEQHLRHVRMPKTRARFAFGRQDAVSPMQYLMLGEHRDGDGVHVNFCSLK